MSSTRWEATGEEPPWRRRTPLHERDWAWRNRLRAMPGVGPAYRLLVGLAGLLVVVLGLVLVPFPGPGWAVVFLGLLVWATEFPQASRVLTWVRGRVLGFGRWLARQSWPVRAAVLALTFATASAIVWCVLFLVGPPPGLPEDWAALAERWAGLPREPIWSR